jgi:integrase
MRFPTMLRDMSVSVDTRKRYTRAVQMFREWCATRGLRITSFVLLDRVLSWYLEWGFQSKMLSFADANYVTSGITFFYPRARAEMVESQRCRSSWAKVDAAHRRRKPPMSWNVTVLVALAMLRVGERAAAVATLLAFDAYLRLGEFTGMKEGHVFLPHGVVQANGARAFVALLATKTGPNQSVLLERDEVVAILRVWMTVRTRWVRGPSLFGLSPARYRLVFGKALDFLGIVHVGFVPHGLRHGGATSDYLSGWPLEDVLMRGRWRSMDTARWYINQGRAMMLLADLPPSIDRRAKLLLPELVRMFTQNLSA